VSDEIIKGKFYTKFPGGGLEFGEGTRECLQREFKEETGLDVSIGDHLYTTDFFQPSAFHTNHQIISIYYWVNCKDLSTLKTTNTINEFSAEQLSANVDCEVFRWIPIKNYLLMMCHYQ
jgi:8-oxo-dGTP diphosphatase